MRGPGEDRSVPHASASRSVSVTRYRSQTQSDTQSRMVVRQVHWGVYYLIHRKYTSITISHSPGAHTLVYSSQKKEDYGYVCLSAAKNSPDLEHRTRYTEQRERGAVCVREVRPGRGAAVAARQTQHCRAVRLKPNGPSPTHMHGPDLTSEQDGGKGAGALPRPGSPLTPSAGGSTRPRHGR